MHLILACFSFISNLNLLRASCYEINHKNERLRISKQQFFTSKQLKTWLVLFRITMSWDVGEADWSFHIRDSEPRLSTRHLPAGGGLHWLHRPHPQHPQQPHRHEGEGNFDDRIVISISELAPLKNTVRIYKLHVCTHNPCLHNKNPESPYSLLREAFKVEKNR